MQLFPDFSIFVQAIVFIAVWVGVNQIVFGPTQNVLSERDRRTVAAEDLAAQLVAAVEVDKSNYEAAVHQRRQQLARESERGRAGAREESTRILTEARSQAGEELAQQRAAVAQQVETARERLTSGAQEVAEQMLERVAGGPAA